MLIVSLFVKMVNVLFFAVLGFLYTDLSGK